MSQLESPSPVQLELWEACRYQNVEDALKALEKGANINCKPGRDCAVAFQGAAYVKGALADACASSATSDSLQLVNVLISKGAEIEDYVIQHAVVSGAVDALKLLLENRKDEDKQELAQTALNAWGTADFTSKSYPILEFLLDLKADPNQWHVPLIICAQDDLLSHAQLLLSRGADINKPQVISGDTSLHKAVEKRNLEMISFLVQNGADQSIKNVDGKTALDLVHARDEEVKEFFGQKKPTTNLCTITTNELNVKSTNEYMLAGLHETFCWYPTVIQHLTGHNFTSLTLSACPHSTKSDLLSLVSLSCPSLSSFSLSLYEHVYPAFAPAEFTCVRDFTVTLRRGFSIAPLGPAHGAPASLRMPALRKLVIQCWFYRGLMHWWGVLTESTISLEHLSLCVKESLANVQIPIPQLPMLKSIEFEKIWNSKLEFWDELFLACPNLEEFSLREAMSQLISSFQLPTLPNFTDGKDSVTTWKIQNKKFSFFKKEPTPEIKPPPPSLANYKKNNYTKRKQNKNSDSEGLGRGKKRKTAKGKKKE